MPSTDYRYSNAEGDIWQHMVNNDDWSYEQLFNYLDLNNVSTKLFSKFLEELTHPLVRDGDDQTELVSTLNKYLKKDQFEIRATSEISGYPVYEVVKLLLGVEGSFKNLIFAADGPKPEIVINDALNNDIKIVKNSEFCLIYDNSINDGLFWSDLVNWWSKKAKLNPDDIETERNLYKRLYKSFERIVIEIDGKHHYSDNNGQSNPQKYSEMMEADRQLKLLGYDLYRFGGYELLKSTKPDELIEDFFVSLFKKHNISLDTV
jgi:hypothetical protein